MRENQNGRCKSHCKTKSPVLRGTQDCTEPLSRLRTMKVHKFAEQDLFKEKQGGQNCDAWSQAELKLENSRPWS